MAVVINLLEIEKHEQYFDEIKKQKIYALTDTDAIPVKIFNLMRKYPLDIEIVTVDSFDDFPIGYLLGSIFGNSKETVYLVLGDKYKTFNNILSVKSIKDIAKESKTTDKPMRKRKKKETATSDILIKPVEDQESKDSAQKILAAAEKNKETLKKRKEMSKDEPKKDFEAVLKSCKIDSIIKDAGKDVKETHEKIRQAVTNSPIDVTFDQQLRLALLDTKLSEMLYEKLCLKYKELRDAI